MAEASVHDLESLDRDVARAAAALERWRRALRSDPDPPERDPFEGPLRHVAGKSTWDALGARPAGAGDAPLRAGLRRWITVMILARLNAPDDLALARESAAARGPFEGEPPRLVSWREAWRGAAHGRTPPEVRLWLDAAAAAARPIADARLARAERRREAARRLGLESPWEAVVPRAVAASLPASAQRLLDATEDLWRSALGELARRAGEPPGPAVVLHAVVARDAGEGWPAQLTARWLADTFGAARKLPIALPPLPGAAGAASFARALQAFGFAVRAAAARGPAPFAVRRDPACLGEHRVAFLFGALAADPEFLARALGLGRARAAAQGRALAMTALFDARLHAARLLLGGDLAPVARDDFDGVAERLFGSRADPRLARAWPGSRDDEPARWAALLQAPSLRRSMRDDFDADWFRNPRAWAFLEGLGAGPAYEEIDAGAIDDGPAALARAFEEALG